MINNTITNNSFFAKMNPSFKFLVFLLSIVVIFLPGGFFPQIILLAIFVPSLFIAKITKKTILNILKTFLIMVVLFILINWITYKFPIAIDTNSFIELGSFPGQDLIWNNNQYGDGILISNIWGGDVHGQITSSMVQDFIKNPNNVNAINRWIRTIDAETLVTLQSKININDFPGLSLDSKNAILYMLNNDFSLNGIDYNVLAVRDTPFIYSNIIFNQNGSLLYSTNWYTISPFTIVKALNIAIKVILIIISSTILTQTTKAVDLTNGLEKLLSPLKVVKFPATECAMILSIGIRFIPSLLSESRRILNAQAARGVDFYNGNLLIKIKALIALIIPLFSISIKKSDDLANAMDARGYSPRQPRTVYRVFPFKYYDYLYLSLIFLIGTIILMMSLFKIVIAPFGILELGAIA